MYAVVTVALMLASVPSQPLYTSNGCDATVSWVSGCNNDGASVTISGDRTQTHPSPDTNGKPHKGSPTSPDTPSKTPCTTPIGYSCEFEAVRVTNEIGQPLTITDVAAFAPSPASTTVEPGNAGVAGMPTNFVSSGAVHTQSGDLFGRPVSVRFSPVGYDFDYGDGTTRSTTDGGRTWAELGQASFTATATSHAYRQRGTYSAHARVRYTAEVDIGNGWFPVSGELTIDGPVQQIRVYEARTALVDRTCTEQPTAPGC